MKSISTFALVSALALSSCSTAGIFGPSADEINARNEQLNAEHRKRNEEIAATEKARKDATKPGMPIAEFKAAYGEPRKTAFVDGSFQLHYAYGEEFTIYTFKNDRLVGWVEDVQEKNRLVQQQNTDSILRVERERIEVEKKARAQPIVVEQAPSRCTSSVMGGVAYTNCN